MSRKGCRYIVKRREKMRPRRGRETGLDHAREQCAEGKACADFLGNCSCIQSAVRFRGTRIDGPLGYESADRPIRHAWHQISAPSGMIPGCMSHTGEITNETSNSNH